jgi:diguanylate cyclase (GGDEF)-like protein
VDYGGEEIKDTQPLICAIRVAERVRKKVEAECLAQQEVSLGGPLTVSVGVASLGEDTATLQQLIRAADVELYRAKSAVKNRVATAGRR